MTSSRPPKWSSSLFISLSPIPGNVASTMTQHRLSRAFEDNAQNCVKLCFWKVEFHGKQWVNIG
jgi:hypothetical protein